jgi:hypothetical protein
MLEKWANDKVVGRQQAEEGRDMLGKEMEVGRRSKHEREEKKKTKQGINTRRTKRERKERNKTRVTNVGSHVKRKTWMCLVKDKIECG